MSEFEVRAFCPSCGFSCVAPFGDIFHVHREVCPNCGHYVHSPRWSTGGGFEIQTVRWVNHPKFRWWNLFTWGFIGHWEDNEGNEIIYPEKRG